MRCRHVLIVRNQFRNYFRSKIFCFGLVGVSACSLAVMALHFSTERPEEQFYTDFNNLNKFEDEVGTHLNYN